MKKNLNKFGYARIAAVTTEIVVADIDFNINQIKKISLEVLGNGCSLAVFPELSLTGYTCADLFYQNALLTRVHSAIEELRQFTEEHKINIIVGAPLASEGKLFNSAIFISCGSILGVVPKIFIPNAVEYYEERWFSSGYDSESGTISIAGNDVPFGTDLIFSASDFPEMKIGIEICEDLWSVVPPSSDLALAGANVLVNLSASDEYIGKAKYRRDLVVSQSARCHAAYLYATAGASESTTDLLFSGHSMIAENGTLLVENERFSFESKYIIADIDIDKLNSERYKNNSFAYGKAKNFYREIEFLLDQPQSEELLRDYPRFPFVPSDKADMDSACREIMSIQSTALAKRLKHTNMRNVVLGLSGGLDSTLALVVCLEAFKKLNIDIKGIHCIIMPGFGTSNRTKSNAEILAERVGVNVRNISISPAVYQHFADIGHDKEVMDVVYENSQARYRTMLLMNIANQVNGLVIGTGDLSEAALGWSTYNGDHMSMYAVNYSVPKTLVQYIIRWAKDLPEFSAAREILEDILDTPISPELLPGIDPETISQETEKKIGPYALHDFFLYYFIRYNYTPRKIRFIAEKAFAGEYSSEEITKWLKLFIKRFFYNQYKRSCMPDTVKVGSIALSPRGDWRMPSDSSPDLWLKDLDS